MKPFYEKNTAVVESEMNVLFEDLLSMTPDEFRVWVGPATRVDGHVVTVTVLQGLDPMGVETQAPIVREDYVVVFQFLLPWELIFSQSQ